MEIYIFYLNNNIKNKSHTYTTLKTKNNNNNNNNFQMVKKNRLFFM